MTSDWLTSGNNSSRFIAALTGVELEIRSHKKIRCAGRNRNITHSINPEKNETILSNEDKIESKIYYIFQQRKRHWERLTRTVGKIIERSR